MTSHLSASHPSVTIESFSSNPIVASKALYRETLLNDVMPFWMRHGFDRQYGGISNLLDDAGNVTGTDKYLWSQGRALWTFSALYNRIEARAEWLEFAHHIYEYLRTYGRDERGYWMYRLDKDGKVLEHDTSLYIDGFVMNGFGEYYRATGNREALELAVQTWGTVRDRLNRPGSYGVAPSEIPPGLQTHGVAMIFSFFAYNLGEIAGREDLCAAGLTLGQKILDEFYVPEKDAILEFVTLDGHFVDTPQGRACVPGHAIEALWFLISIFERSGETERIPQCCRLIQRHLELAWDEQYGGLLLALDIDGREPLYWKHADHKPWWVAVEALVATAYAFLYTGEDWAAEWHARIRDWTFAHYPVSTGEWTQWLNREGQPAPPAVLPLKDPFHLPRALITLSEIIPRIEQKLINEKSFEQ